MAQYCFVIPSYAGASLLRRSACCEQSNERLRRQPLVERGVLHVDDDRAHVILLAVGPSHEQIAAADAAVAQAETALRTLDIQADKLMVHGPTESTVLVRSIHVGEIVSAGADTFVLGKLNMLQITVYLPEDVYGRVKLGQTAKATVDSYPGVTFTATVVHIADRAEFTPRNVQTVEGRSTTVYAIKLDVPNPDGKLKPGMPADVNFES